MDSTPTHSGRQGTRAALALFSAALLVPGATAGALATAHSTAAQAAAAEPVTTSITHAVAGERDSYADVVKVVAPAVVTIRTEGKAKASPTDFEPQGDDDLFRRFFGGQFNQQFGQQFGQQDHGQ